MIQLIREIIKYRELIWALALKELRVRYKRSFLGFLWALLHPLLMMIVYTIVFSTIFSRDTSNYSIFLISGLFPWTFFSQSLSYSVSSMDGNSALLKKVRVAKSVFVVSAILANLLNFLFSLVPLVILILVLGHPFYWTWVYFPVPLLCLILFTLGVGFFFSTLNVFFRDVAHIIQIILSAWFYFTPILYTLDFISPKYHILFKLNPMLYIMNGFHLSVYYGMLPTAASITMSVACGIAPLLIGYYIFRKYQDTFIFYL